MKRLLGLLTVLAAVSLFLGGCGPGGGSGSSTEPPRTPEEMMQSKDAMMKSMQGGATPPATKGTPTKE
ncbi:MAG: hypothetical protein A2V98_24315 [Planctomycetes bacterium RBG_16_64_12]|nr:MAG: hypothetical protein A2V98_24315 [Planctomycetes bacterium RBG_16_64_12]